MANLQDIVEAVNRLADRMGTPQQAAQAMQPGNGIPAPTQPTVPAGATPTGHDNSSIDAIANGFAHAVGRVPVLREISRHLMFAQNIAGYLPHLKTAASTLSGMAKTGVPVAQAVGGAAAEGAVGAEILGASSKLVAAFANPVVAIGGLVTAAGAAAAALVAFGKSIADANRALAGYSGLMATAFALSDLRDVFRDMASAQRRAGTTSEWLSTWGNFKDKMQPITDGLSNTFLNAATHIVEAVTPLVEVFGKLLEPTLALLNLLMDTVGKGSAAQVMAETGMLNGVMDAGDWIGKQLRGAFGGDSTGTAGSISSQSRNMEQVIKDAIQSINNLNASMQKAMPGSSVMSAGLFMAGVATAPTGFQVKHRHFEVQRRIYAGVMERQE